MESFNENGNTSGKPFIMWDDSIQFLKVRQEANGGLTIQVVHEDEFGLEMRLSLSLDKLDFESLRQLIA